MLLEEGLRQQQLTDELLADADAAVGKAQDAVHMGEKTLEEAQKTLETLEGDLLLIIMPIKFQTK